MQSQEKKMVWDVPVRVFHWLLVTSIIGSWVTAKLGVEYTEYHMRFGYFTLGLLIFRVIWGVIGTHYAQFFSFPVSPKSLKRYAPKLLSQDSPIFPGHNPLGALMVFVLMGLLAVQVFTGFFVNDDILYVGPYNPIVSKSVAKELTSLHHLNSDILLAAMALHVIAVLFYQFYKRQNLVGSMVTGKKAVPTTVETIKDSRIWAAVLAAAVAAAIVYGLLSFAPEPNYEDFF